MPLFNTSLQETRSFQNLQIVGEYSIFFVYIVTTMMILGLRPANERRCYFVTKSLIGWAQTSISLLVIESEWTT